MKPDETDLIRNWVAAEGWNPGVHDAKCFFAADPQGVFIGEVSGEPVSMISCVAHDASFGFAGLYIVKRDFRGRGYGYQTWKSGIEYLGARTIGLDGVLEQQQNYERSGFVFAYNHLRFRGEGGGSAPAGLVPLGSIPFEDVLAFDTARAPSPRPRFLRGWLDLPESVGLASTRNGKLSGFGMLRRCVEGYKIGPLLADDVAAAEALLRGLLAQFPGQPIFLDAPDAAPAPIDLASRFGMKEVFRTARMYTRPVAAPLGGSRIPGVFGIASMELG
ncbi:GNAT family N-acetyltransferase [Pendulispora albinea]|uniref:N-acetyltransferase domain-containing protein n=1 Tax=Pendulispora albinea TaxID=2741071 RepID=A0ABZ2M4A8_9BACT